MKGSWIASACFGVSVLVLGCAQSADDHDGIEARNAEIIDNLLEAGFAEDEIVVREGVGIDDEGKLVESQQVFVDGDVHVTLEASRELLGDADGDHDSFRLWRTPSVVNSPSTVCVAKITSAQAPYGAYALTNTMIQGVDLAVGNYAGLGAGFSLTVVTGTGSLSSTGLLSTGMAGCSSVIYVYQVPNGQIGGQAGFPSGGLPYNQVQLWSGLTGFNLDIHEHVATHELGHSIGLRHADWKTRSSCGQNQNEGQSGAVQIPGTVDQTTNSIMAACFGGGATGEFLGQDALALTTLY